MWDTLPAVEEEHFETAQSKLKQAELSSIKTYYKTLHYYRMR